MTSPDDQRDDQGAAVRHDPTGLELARMIANSVRTTSPLPAGPAPKKPKKRQSAPLVRSKGDPVAIGTAMDDLMTERGWGTVVNVHTILQRWPALVGATIADHTVVESYHDHVVTVRADSTAWAINLRSLAPNIVANLNEHLGEGTVRAIVAKAPQARSWKHGKRSVRDGRGPRDTYG